LGGTDWRCERRGGAPGLWPVVASRR
jgi:hypothetical protein